MNNDEEPTGAEDFLKRLAAKVPGHIAGSVLIAVVFIWVSPSILSALNDEEEKIGYLLILAVIIVTCAYTIAISTRSVLRIMEASRPTRETLSFAKQVEEETRKAVDQK